ncbi:B12-binding domain-containing radical SAM protein [Aminipila luticellarii]|uniref:B12-binding domain-containing radical SAM protein n=1 Tax=Aminipila luticellarii TaxID=2507160 RepID=A0A410PWG6_9FIRM|nr:radical SAM protein [Aminipila luticellarii]QAT43293.1 B12-binding domain-containing radical SAM protein [Aminipila luticellarii]
MKILLTTLNAKYIHSNLALKYLYMSAVENRRSMDIREFTINNDDDYIYTEMIRGDYSAICFSCYIWNITRTVRLAENIKKASPDIKILMGGPEVSYDSIEFLRKHKCVDYIIVGEGEEVFKEFVQAFLRRDHSFDRIKGLIYRSDGKIYVNPPADLQDFDLVPFPYSFLLPKDDRIVYYESVRGCPFRCSYCLSSIEKHVRPLPLERVQKELGFFLFKHVKQVKFIDRTFNYDRDRCNQIVKYILDNDNGVTNFHFEICGDLIDDEFLYLLGKARKGLFQVEIGIQSLNPLTLEAVNRNKNTDYLLTNIRKIIELGNVHTHVDLIAGLPFEDYLSFMDSFNGVYQLGADQFQLGFLKLLKGTKIREEKNVYEYVFRDTAPYEVIANQFISAEGITRLKMVENLLDLYYNRGGFFRTLEYAIARFQITAFDFYEELAYFFYLKGYQNRSHKKEDLYRIFFEYACWKDRSLPGSAVEIQKLLMQDMSDTLNPEAVKKFNKKGWSMI